MNLSKGSNSKLVKLHNQSLVLNVIQQKGFISRRDIATLTGLTQATITNITNNLLNHDLIKEEGKDASSKKSGRKAILLSINKEKFKIMTIYIGRQILQGAISDLAGNFLYIIEKQKGIINDPEISFETELIGFIKDLIAQSQTSLDQILGIGLSAPGPINAKKGVFLKVPNKGDEHISPAPFDWRNIPVKEIIQKEFNLKVYADNEANVLALAESWFGSGVGINNFVLYSIGVGIGSGVVIDGMLYRGEDDVVSEIGHITIDYKGKECICGNVGCLEHYASFKALLARYYEKTGRDGIDSLDNPDFNLISEVENIFKLAYGGNPVAKEVVEELCGFLSIGAISLANLYSPEYIILSGNDAGDIDFDVLVPGIQQNIRKRAFSVIADKVTITSSKLGKYNHLFGGVALVLQDYFPNIEEDGQIKTL